MRRGITLLFVLGLAGLLTAAELGLDKPTEVKDIESEISKGNSAEEPPASDKTKRGVSKLGNTDNPTFNHLSSSSSTGSNNVKTATNNAQVPYRYVYNNQYYQSNPFVSYVQSPQAAQIASQYSFQPSALAHYLHTPTQIQYVSSPTIASRYQTIGSKAVGATAATTTASNAQFQITPAQQFYISPQSLYQGQAAGAAAAHTTSSSTSASANAASQYHAPQQLYYQQQPIVMLLVQQQPNPAALLLPQQHQASYVLGQNPFLNVYNNHRFSLPYTAVPNNQITYLVPMAVQTTSQQVSAGVKTANDKAATNIQTQSGVPYGVRTTKA